MIKRSSLFSFTLKGESMVAMATGYYGYLGVVPKRDPHATWFGFTEFEDNDGAFTRICQNSTKLIKFERSVNRVSR